MGFFGRLLGREKPGQPETPKQEVPKTEQAEKQPRTREDLHTIGEARMEKVGKFFAGIGEKIKGAFGRIIPMAKEAGIAVLAGPEILKEGLDQTSEAVANIGKGAVETVKTGAEFVAGATVAGAEAVGRGVKAGAEFTGEKAREAMDASVNFFKEDWNKTKEHANAAKEFISTDWNKTKEHGQAMVDTVKGVGVKTGEFIQNTKERTKEIIAEKIGRLQEYGNHIKFVANEIKTNAQESIKSLVEKTGEVVGGIIEKARGGILAGIDRLKGKLESYRRMAEIAKEAKTKEQLNNVLNLAKKLNDERQEELGDINKIVIVR